MASLQIVVDYKTALTPPLRGHILMTFVETLLFMRQQVPCILPQLEAWCENDCQSRAQTRAQTRRRRHLASGAGKRARRISAALAPLRRSSVSLFATPVEEVALVLGASLNNPKETYLLRFHGPFVPCGCVPNEQILMGPVARKFTRALMQQAADVLTTRMAPTRLHVLVRTSRSRDLADFLPKQSYGRKRTGRRTRSAPVIVVNVRRSVTEPETVPSLEGAGDQDHLWYQLRTRIQGFRGVLPAAVSTVITSRDGSECDEDIDDSRKRPRVSMIH